MPDAVIPAEIFKEIRDVVKQYDYELTTEEAKAIKSCAVGVPIVQLLFGVGAFAAAWRLTSFKPLKKYRGARLLGSTLVAIRGTYFGADMAHYACLERLAELKSPLGGEVTELIRQKDANHFTIRGVPKRMEGDPMGRIASDAARQRMDVHNRQRADSSCSKAPGGFGEAATSEAGHDNPWDQLSGEASWDLPDALSQPESAAAEEEHQAGSRASRRDREERRREKRRSLQRQEGGGQEGALDDYFDSRWDERRPD